MVWHLQVFDRQSLLIFCRALYMKQGSLFDNVSSPEAVSDDADCYEVIKPELQDGELLYFPQFIGTQEADDYLAVLQQTLQWQQDEMVIYGRSVAIPRLQAWYGDSDARYSYSGIDMLPTLWTDELLALKKRCEHQLTCQFNSVLANRYRDGNDSVGLHADDEVELGVNPVIAALSFGQTRTLNFRHKNTKTSLSLPLEHGSLLVMSGATQRFWHHGINKSKRPMIERISLTFRRIYPELKL